MKNTGKILFFMILVSCLFQISAYADQYENFDTYSNGVIPDNWLSGDNTDEYRSEIVPDPVNSKNKVIAVKGDNIRNFSAMYLDTSYSGVIEFEYDIYLKDTSRLQHLPCPAHKQTDVLGLMTEKNSIIYSGGQRLLYKPFTYNKWHHIKTVMDTGDLSYKIYLDNVAAFKGKSNLNKNAMKGIDRIVMAAELSTMYIDNISIKKVADSKNVKFLLGSDLYRVDYEKHTIGNLNYYDDYSKVYDSLFVYPGAKAEFAGDRINVSYGAKTESYTILKRKRAVSKYTDNALNSIVIMKKGSDKVYFKGTSNILREPLNTNHLGQIVVNYSDIAKCFKINKTWDEQRFGSEFTYHDRTYFKRAPFKIGSKDGFRIKVFTEDKDTYEENIYLTERELLYLGIKTIKKGEYVVFTTLDRNEAEDAVNIAGNVFEEI